MSVSIGKGQVDHIASEIRKQLYAIGDEQREALRSTARERFFRTKEGKRIQHLRAKYGSETYCSRIGSEIVSDVEERAVKGVTKPFSYLNCEDIGKRVSIMAMDVNTGNELIEAVKRSYYKTLAPDVRKRFNLKLS